MYFPCNWPVWLAVHGFSTHRLPGRHGDYTHTDLASGVLQCVQAHVSLPLISLMGLRRCWNHLFGSKLRKHSNLVGCLHPDVIRGRDDANVSPPEVSYNTEQHRRGPRHGVSKGGVVSSVVQLIANATPRKHSLEVGIFAIRKGKQKVDEYVPANQKFCSHINISYFIPAFAQHWSSITVSGIGRSNVPCGLGVETQESLKCPWCLTWLLKNKGEFSLAFLLSYIPCDASFS